MFDILTDDDMLLLESRAQRMRFPANTQLISQRTENKGVFWITEGLVQVEMSSLFTNRIIAGIGPGEIVGEMSFILDDHRSTTSVVAFHDTEALFIERDELVSLLDENDGFAARFYKMVALTLANRLKAQTQS